MSKVAHLSEFTIKGADGEDHVYECMAHPPDEGLDIIWILISLGGEPLARLAQSAMASVADEAGKETEDLMEEDEDGNAVATTSMAKILAGLEDFDLETLDLSGAAKDLTSSIMSLPMTSLVKKMLKHCTRDGKSLEKKSEYDRAYTANYMELMTAVWRVVAANNFLPQVVTSSLG